MTVFTDPDLDWRLQANALIEGDYSILVSRNAALVTGLYAVDNFDFSLRNP